MIKASYDHLSEDNNIRDPHKHTFSGKQNSKLTPAHPTYLVHSFPNTCSHCCISPLLFWFLYALSNVYYQYAQTMMSGS